MSKSYSGLSQEASLIVEKLDFLLESVDRFRRQEIQAFNLQKKVRLLLEETQRIQKSLKSSAKSINSQLSDLRTESVFSESTQPFDDKWNLQFKLKEAENDFQEVCQFSEQSYETFLEDIQVK